MANIKENKRFHFTYKTTNLINNRYYLGMHSTNRIDDGYLGSGKRLYYELNKYGRNNFKFEILEQFNSREELVQAEIKLITEQDLESPNCLNCKPGGQGGLSTSEHAYKFHAAGGKAVKRLLSGRHLEKMKTDPEYRESCITRRKEGLIKAGFSEGTFKNRKHSEEAIRKMKEARKGTGKGDSNSQYGTCWITDDIVNRKIHKGNPIPEGWRLGRIPKK
jgi:hypothetical protein